MSENIKINCPKCESENSVTVVGTTGANVDESGKLYEKGVAITECEVCKYMMQTEKEVEAMLKIKLAQEGNIKKIAIACDTYKVETYLKELKKYTFTVSGTQQQGKLTTILVECSFTRIDRLTNLVKIIESTFKRKN